MLVYKLLRGRFWGFLPHRADTALLGWNLAWAWRNGPIAKLHPHWCNDKGIGPQNRKFYQISEYKCPTGVYFLCNFYRICRVCTLFQDALAVKIWINGLQSNGGLKLRGRISQEFSVPHSGETICWTLKVLEVQERARGPLSPCQVWWGLDFTHLWGGQKRWFFVCLSVCPWYLSARNYLPAFGRRRCCKAYCLFLLTRAQQ